MTDVFDPDPDGVDDVRAQDLCGPTGGPRVHNERCTTCIYRPGNRMQLRDGALAQLSEDARDTFITCHDTLPSTTGGNVPPAVCRGWWDGYADESPVIQTLIMIYGEPVFVAPPSREETRMSEVDRTAQLDEVTKRVIFTASIAELDDYVKKGNAPGAGPRARAKGDAAMDRLRMKAIDEDIREHGGYSACLDEGATSDA